MSYSLNSLKGGYIGEFIGDTIRVFKEDTRSLDNGSNKIVDLKVPGVKEDIVIRLWRRLPEAFWHLLRGSA